MCLLKRNVEGWNECSFQLINLINGVYENANRYSQCIFHKKRRLRNRYHKAVHYQIFYFASFLLLARYSTPEIQFFSQINFNNFQSTFFRRRPVLWRFIWRRLDGSSFKRCAYYSYKRTGTHSPCWPIKHRRRHCGVPNCGRRSRRPPCIRHSQGFRRRLERKVCSGQYFGILLTHLFSHFAFLLV